MESLIALKKDVLKESTLQLWIPDRSSEEGFYIGSADHGIALCDLELSTSGKGLLKIVKDACKAGQPDFEALSAMATGHWPVILTACRHYRLPVPPQLWLEMIYPNDDPEQEAA